MRALLKIGAIIASLYVLFWVGLALYFSFAERHKELFEANLESLFDREVSISEVRTAWLGLTPAIQINGFEVAGDHGDEPALAFDSMSAELDLLSLLKFWPKLTAFAIEAPLVEVVILPDNRIQVAGMILNPSRASGGLSKRLISWLINHESMTWYDGEVVWRRPQGVTQRYSDVSFVYERQQENRSLTAAMVTEEGALVISAESNGNMLYDSEWDASLEVLGDQGRRLLSSDDLLLVVENGRGSMQLRALNVERVRDFLLLTGLSETAKWVMESRLDGILKNVQFDFSGPFLQFHEWSLRASASDVSFLPTSGLPGMNQLAGSILATRDGGRFEFLSDNAVFHWPKLFDQEFKIEQTEGRFRWEIGKDEVINVHLEEASFSDGTLTIESVDAHCAINARARRVGALADWFTAGKVEDLRFEDGQIVSRAEDTGVFLRAKARFSISDFKDTYRYIPNDPRVAKLRAWWQNAFVDGVVSSAEISFAGPVNRQAIRDGNAQIYGRADFHNVKLDYGYQRDWPILSRSSGVGILTNQGLTITPSEAWIGKDKLTQGVVAISPIFEKGRVLDIKGEMTSSLETVAEFLFNGPLISPEQKALQADQPLPVDVEGGTVNAKVDVHIPLKQVRNTKVLGSATVRNGRIVLPSGVAVDKVSTEMSFTERSASAERITADFLGGTMKASLITTQAAQPPKLKLIGRGRADVGALEPWTGEHIQSWFSGITDWQGELGFDGALVTIDVKTDLQGVSVAAPEPLLKSAETASDLSFAMRTGGKSVTPELALDYGEHLRVHMIGDPLKENKLFDRARIVVAENARTTPRISPPGINFFLQQNVLDLDAWLSAVIELASLETTPFAEGEKADTSFLDAMRSIRLSSPSIMFLGRPFGSLDAGVVTPNGHDWIGTLMGDNINGTIKASPRDDLASYKLNLAYFHLVEAPPNLTPPGPIDQTLKPSAYPRIELSATTFVVSDKTLGRLQLASSPDGDVWKVHKFSVNNTDISTTGYGEWSNTADNGSQSSFSLETKIDEAGGVLDDMKFDDLIRKGEGHFKGNLGWIGAPHEFDFARLNGDFDLQINDGELVKVESGAGRLIGLLNFNSILRRLTLDFRDVFSSGLKFDKMQYSGIVAEGKAILQEAFMLSPAVFVQMEGNIDLNREEIDMEIHASPELGGNLALLSAIANPTAGAVVFLTQRIFKDQMRSNSLLSYRALGSWKDFELAEISDEGEPVSKPENNNLQDAGE